MAVKKRQQNKNQPSKNNAQSGLSGGVVAPDNPGGKLLERPGGFGLLNWKKAIFSPLPTVPRIWLREAGPMAVVIATVFLLYAVTSPRQVTLEDDGLFLMNLYYWGVNHPPGYPLYILFGSPFFHMLPDFISPALRGHLFSSLCGAVASGAVYAITSMLVRGRAAAFAAGLAFGASKVLWSQSIIAEVYSLNAMMFFIVMALCIQYGAHRGQATGRHRALFCVIVFIYGLGLSNHWPLLGLGSIGLLMLVISQWKTLFTRLPLGLLFLALGLLPYLFLVLRSQTDVELNFYGPISSMKELFFYVARSGYSGVDKQAGVGLFEKIAFTKFMSSELFFQITPVGFALAWAGLVALMRTRAQAWLATSLLVSFFMAGPLLIYLIDFKAEFIWFSAFRVYPILTYGIFAIWFGVGAGWLTDWTRAKLGERRSGLLLAASVAPVAAVVVFAGSIMSHWNENNRRNYIWARDLAMFKIASVEPSTLLFTFDDLDLPLAYLNYVEKVRPDVQVFNDQGLVFANRVFIPFTTDEQRKRRLSKLIDTTDKPIYYHPSRTSYYRTNRNGSDFLGFWRRVNREDATDRLVLSESLLLWLENSLDTAGTISDRWTRQQAYGLVSTLVSTIQQAAASGFPLESSWNKVIERAYNENPLAHLVLLWNKIAKRSIKEEQALQEIEWLEKNAAGDGYSQILDASNRSDMMLLRTQLGMSFPKIVEGDVEDFVEESLKSALNYKFKKQPARLMVDLYRRQGRLEDAIFLLENQFPNISLADKYYRELHAQLIRERQTGRLLTEPLKTPSS